jgi:hypothetical protein
MPLAQLSLFRRTLAVAAVALLTSASAHAASDCVAKADEKKLHGAAKTSVVKKCEKDGGGGDKASACETQAADKKLHGAAKNSFVKKCESEAQPKPKA